MSRSQVVDVNGVLFALATALLGALLAYFALLFVARPPSVSTRFEAALRRTDEAEQLLRRRNANPSTFSRAAVCAEGSDAGAAQVRQNLTTLASRAGVAIEDLQAQPLAADESNGGLQSVRLTVAARGASTSIQSLLQTLAAATPSIFIDTLDLQPANGQVLLKFSGRFFCSAVRP